MEEQKELEVSGGQIMRKCPIEHFTERQFMYGSPYNYIIKYGDYSGGSPERRYGLWKFDDKTLKYTLFKTSNEEGYRQLSDIANEWEDAMREERHIEHLKTMPRSFWPDRDQIKYAHIKTIEENDGAPEPTPLPKKRAKKADTLKK